MNIPRYAELAKRALSKATSGEPPPPTTASRDAAIHAMEEALRAKSRRVLRGRIAVGTASFAAAASIALFLVHRREEARVDLRGAPSAAVAAIVVHASGDGASIVGGVPDIGGDQVVSSGARIVALPHGHALMAFATGTKVNVDEGGDVTIVDKGPAQVLALGGGAMRADVAKLKAGERFIVRTVDAEIEVHGTSFRVETVTSDPSCGNGTRTRLTVFEGIVTVRANGSEVAVPAGDVWPAACAPKPAPVAHTPSAPSAASSQSGASTAIAPAPVVPDPTAITPPISELTEENDLFAAAVAERRAGHLRAAVDRYDAFLARYPNAPLAESAASQRMKVLRDAKDPRAVSAARSYLARFPSGYARSDAESIAAGQP